MTAAVVDYRMAEIPDETPEMRLRMAFHLVELAEKMLRQRLRRESPHLSDDDIEQQIAAWYRRRPGAELGDGQGRPAQWPRR